MARKTSPNRLGTKLSSDFVQDAIEPDEDLTRAASAPIPKEQHKMFVKSLKKQVRPEVYKGVQESQSELDERFACHDTEDDLDHRFSQGSRRKSEGFHMKGADLARLSQ